MRTLPLVICLLLALSSQVLAAQDLGGMSQEPAEGLDTDLRQIVSPWYRTPTALPITTNNVSTERLIEFLATSQEWRLTSRHGDLEATRRYCSSAGWSITASGEYGAEYSDSGKTRCRYIALRIYPMGVPCSELVTGVRPIEWTNSSSASEVGQVVVFRDGDNYFKSIGMLYGRSLLLVKEKSETTAELVVRRAMDYLRTVVDRSPLHEIAPTTNEGGSNTPSLTVTRGRIPGEYYAQCTVSIPARGVCYLRILDGSGRDVVPQTALFNDSQQVLGSLAGKPTNCLYDCWFTLTNVRWNFKDGGSYTIELHFRDQGSEKETILASLKTELESFER
jgi:hypothetical protein